MIELLLSVPAVWSEITFETTSVLPVFCHITKPKVEAGVFRILAFSCSALTSGPDVIHVPVSRFIAASTSVILSDSVIDLIAYLIFSVSPTGGSSMVPSAAAKPSSPIPRLSELRAVSTTWRVAPALSPATFQ